MSPLSIITNQIGSEVAAQQLIAALEAEGYMLTKAGDELSSDESTQFTGGVFHPKQEGVSQQQKVQGYLDSNDIVSAITLGGVSIDACDDHLGALLDE